MAETVAETVRLTFIIQFCTNPSNRSTIYITYHDTDKSAVYRSSLRIDHHCVSIIIALYQSSLQCISHHCSVSIVTTVYWSSVYNEFPSHRMYGNLEYNDGLALTYDSAPWTTWITFFSRGDRNNCFSEAVGRRMIASKRHLGECHPCASIPLVRFKSDPLAAFTFWAQRGLAVLGT